MLTATLEEFKPEAKKPVGMRLASTHAPVNHLDII